MKHQQTINITTMFAIISLIIGGYTFAMSNFASKSEVNQLSDRMARIERNTDDLVKFFMGRGLKRSGGER